MSALSAVVPCVPGSMPPSADHELPHARPAVRERGADWPTPVWGAPEAGSRAARANRDVGWQLLTPVRHATPESSGANREMQIADTAIQDVPLPFVAAPAPRVRSPGVAPRSRSPRLR